MKEIHMDHVSNCLRRESSKLALNDEEEDIIWDASEMQLNWKIARGRFKIRKKARQKLK